MLYDMKTKIKHIILTFFKHVLVKDEIKSTLIETLSNPFLGRTTLDDALANSTIRPYTDLGTGSQPDRIAERDDIIFISGRFRSGSTLLWNIFRTISGVTAYYEPFNENQWFDPSISDRGVDETHRMVDDYRKEYQGLTMLSACYREDWIRKNIFMENFFYEPSMKQFVTLLIEHAPNRPVLQFNRIDFRLPWIRQHFPNARIIHIYRHPRDQWCSTLRDLSLFPPDGSIEQFARHDKFYLRIWAQDLQYHFPFLDEYTVTHPYELFYYIWKLSFIFGTTYADFSVCFEHLIEKPSTVLTPLFEKLQFGLDNIAKAEKLIVQPDLGKWKKYADDQWFSRIESHCETTLYYFLLSQKNL